MLKMDVGFPGGSMVKNLPTNAGDTGDMGLILELGRSPGGGHGNPFQYSCLKNLCTEKPGCTRVQRVAESVATERLSNQAHKYN